jgi:hypothetical protein
VDDLAVLDEDDARALVLRQAERRGLARDAQHLDDVDGGELGEVAREAIPPIEGLEDGGAHLVHVERLPHQAEAAEGVRPVLDAGDVERRHHDDPRRRRLHRGPAEQIHPALLGEVDVGHEHVDRDVEQDLLRDLGGPRQEHVVAVVVLVEHPVESEDDIVLVVDDQHLGST